MEKMENVTYMQAGPVLIIGLPEEVDDHVCNGIREETDRYISAGKVQKLIFDFSKTGFMDSSGIGILLGRYKRMQMEEIWKNNKKNWMANGCRRVCSA